MDFYEAFSDLMTRVTTLPSDLSEMRRRVGMLITEEKYRRMEEARKLQSHICIMEESDLNKLAEIKDINALSWKLEIEKGGRLKRSLNSVRPFICDACWNKYDLDGMAKRKKEHEERKEQYKIAIQEAQAQAKEKRISDYIATYGKKGWATPSQVFHQMGQSLDSADFEKLATMDYREFLQTKYWFAVRNYVLYRQDYQCNLCSKKSRLQVHHKHYKNRGREILGYNWRDDLIVLCETCHAKQHNKIVNHA